MRSFLPLLLACSLALSACASSGSSRSYGSSDTGLTGDQRTLRSNAERVTTKEHRRNVKGEGTLIGAGLGAALGCGLGLLLSDNKGAGCAIGAAAGGAVGAAGGYAAGSWVASRQEDYASQEAYLDAVIAGAEEEIVENRAAAAAAKRVVAQHSQRIAELNQLYRSKQISAESYRNEYGQMETDGEAIEAAIESNEEKLKKLRQAINENTSGASYDRALQERYDQLARETGILEQQLETLVGALGTVPSDARV